MTEYERAVILRLGRLSSRRAKGPGKILRQYGGGGGALGPDAIKN